MVHFINGSDSGDILCRAEVLPRINKVKMAALESYGIVFFFNRVKSHQPSNGSMARNYVDTFWMNAINYLNYSILIFHH